MFFHNCIASVALIILRASVDIRQSCKVPHKDTIFSLKYQCIMKTNPFSLRNSEKCCTNTSARLFFSVHVTSHKSMTQHQAKHWNSICGGIKALWNSSLLCFMLPRNVYRSKSLPVRYGKSCLIEHILNMFLSVQKILFSCLAVYRLHRQLIFKNAFSHNAVLNCCLICGL